MILFVVRKRNSVLVFVEAIYIGHEICTNDGWRQGKIFGDRQQTRLGSAAVDSVLMKHLYSHIKACIFSDSSC